MRPSWRSECDDVIAGAAAAVVAGRYTLTPGIVRAPERSPRGVGGEIQLTEGIAQLLRREKALIGVRSQLFRAAWPLFRL